MSRRIAVVRFNDGHTMFGLYETIGDRLREFLWDTEAGAEAHLDCGVSRLISNDPKADEEDVDVMPYALSGDNTTYFCSRASRSTALITGPLSRDDVLEEIKKTEVGY